MARNTAVKGLGKVTQVLPELPAGLRIEVLHSEWHLVYYAELWEEASGKILYATPMCREAGEAVRLALEHAAYLEACK
jgi:hypothetical protein